MPFRLLIDLEPLKYLNRPPSKRRRAIFDHLHRIRVYPAQHSKLTRRSPEGRTLHVASVAGLQIVYWIDDADRHIKILYLEEND